MWQKQKRGVIFSVKPSIKEAEEEEQLRAQTHVSKGCPPNLQYVYFGDVEPPASLRKLGLVIRSHAPGEWETHK